MTHKMVKDPWNGPYGTLGAPVYKVELETWEYLKRKKDPENEDGSNGKKFMYTSI